MKFQLPLRTISLLIMAVLSSQMRSVIGKLGSTLIMSSHSNEEESTDSASLLNSNENEDYELSLKKRALEAWDFPDEVDENEPLNITRQATIFENVDNENGAVSRQMQTLTARLVSNNRKKNLRNLLGVCEGDCDSDAECEDNLVCYQKDRGDPVPGCNGGVRRRTDYCIHPDWISGGDNGGGDGGTGGGGGGDNDQSLSNIRLKLYWEFGYVWQDKTFERKWCMMYDYKGRPGTGKCWYGREVRPCVSTDVYIARCNDDQRQKFEIVLLDGSQSEGLIKVDGQNRCFQRSGTTMFLTGCNRDNELQRWITYNGDYTSRRFEISQSSLPSHCVTQAHHPKPGEVVELHPCRRARLVTHQSSFWNRY